MDKKTLIIIFIVFDLLVVAAYFLFFRTSGTVDKTETEFSVSDTTIIDKIVIVESNDSIIIQETDNYWTVNNSFTPKSENIITLLNTLNLIELKSPIPDNAQEFIKSSLIKAKRVDIYSENRIIKSFYIGSQTSDKMGNYIMLRKSEKAYIVHIPAIKTDISNSFPSDEKSWKSNSIFSYAFDEIAEIEVFYSEKPEESFKLKKDGNNCSVWNNSDELNENIDNEKITRYISYFSDVKFEEYNQIEDISLISKTTPFVTISVTDNSGIKNQFSGFYIISNDKKDVNKFNGIINNSELVFVKFYDFDLILKTISYFN
jgi:hypothetical protein